MAQEHSRAGAAGEHPHWRDRRPPIPVTGTLTITGVRWPFFVGTFRQPAHIFRQSFHVERSMLHVVADIVGECLCVLLALLERAGCPGMRTGVMG